MRGFNATLKKTPSRRLSHVHLYVVNRSDNALFVDGGTTEQTIPDAATQPVYDGSGSNQELVHKR